MIELCFSESLAGSLKFASLMRKGETLAGCSAFAALGGTRRERARARREARRPQVWQGETLDLSPANVRPLTFALDFGPLDDLPERRGALETLFGGFPEAYETILRTNAETLRLLTEARKTAAPVRVWISPHDPGDVCGLYFLCDFLAGADAPLYVVSLPACEAREDSFLEYRGGEDVPPEALGAAAQKTETLSPSARTAYAFLWRTLREESAPLRAYVNGRILNVPEDFYDFALRRSIPEGAFPLAQAIGRALNELPGVSDRLLFLRAQEMQRRGEIIAVAPPKDDHPYSGVFRKKAQEESGAASPARL